MGFLPFRQFVGPSDHIRKMLQCAFDHYTSCVLINGVLSRRLNHGIMHDNFLEFFSEME